jgi:hypothetical protein
LQYCRLIHVLFAQKNTIVFHLTKKISQHKTHKIQLIGATILNKCIGSINITASEHISMICHSGVFPLIPRLWYSMLHGAPLNKTYVLQ